MPWSYAWVAKFRFWIRCGNLAACARAPILLPGAILPIRWATQRLLRMAGEVALMEYAAAALYRTYCVPALVSGLMKTGRLRDKTIERMVGTYLFLITMYQYPVDHPQAQRALRKVKQMHEALGLAAGA